MTGRQTQGEDMSEIRALLAGVSDRVDAAAKDAREARDATIALTSRLSAENTSEQLSKIWARIEANDTQWRSDLVNGLDRAASARKELEGRIDELESWRQRLEGANGLVRWVSKYAPWALSALFGAFAVFGKKLLP